MSIQANWIQVKLFEFSHEKRREARSFIAWNSVPARIAKAFDLMFPSIHLRKQVVFMIETDFFLPKWNEEYA